MATQKASVPAPTAEPPPTTQGAPAPAQPAGQLWQRHHHEAPIGGIEEDRIGFGGYAQMLAGLIRNASDTGITLGIYGPWGSGKSSLMRLIREKLGSSQEGPQFLFVEFQAWRYARQEEALWRSLLLHIIDEISAKSKPDTAQPIHRRLRHWFHWKQRRREAELAKKFDTLRSSLYRSIENKGPGRVIFDPQAALAVTLRLLVSIALLILLPLIFISLITALLSLLIEITMGNLGDEQMRRVFLFFVVTALGGIFLKLGESLSSNMLQAIRVDERSTIIEHITSLEQFHKTFRELVSTISESKQHLTIFIDDIDRCTPSQIVGVLEAIKSFLDVPGCSVIIGIDEAIVRRGLLSHYSMLSTGPDDSEYPRDYLAKIIQFQVDVPHMNLDDSARFVTALLEGQPDFAGNAEVGRNLALFVGSRPRALKRAASSLMLLNTLVSRYIDVNNPDNPIRRSVLATIVGMRHGMPLLYEACRQNPDRFYTLYRDISREDADIRTYFPQTLSEENLERYQTAFNLNYDTAIENYKRIFQLFSDVQIAAAPSNGAAAPEALSAGLNEKRA